MKRRDKPTTDQTAALFRALEPLPATDVRFTARNRFILRIDGQWLENDEYEFAPDPDFPGRIKWEAYTTPIRQPDLEYIPIAKPKRQPDDPHNDDSDESEVALWEAETNREAVENRKHDLDSNDDGTDFARLGFDQAEFLDALRKGRNALADYVRQKLTAAGFDTKQSGNKHRPTVDAAVARVLAMFRKELDYIEERQDL
jgi:hypothetical protein